MVGGLDELRVVIQDALDDICSPRTSPAVKSDAFERLEKQLAISCLLSDEDAQSKESWEYLMALQYTFECNIPSRLVAWIAACTPKLEPAPSRGTPDSEHALPSHVARALTIIQGIALIHDSTKVYLGRRYCLEVFLDLLLASRHLATPTSAHQDNRPNPAGRTKPSANVPLTSIVLDTLLCILVDSYQALRVFEDVNGVQAVVKILKRAGTPREVRMKCLEFIYFYLLDETESASNERLVSMSARSTATAATIMTPAATPSPQVRTRSKPSLNETPARPLSRHGSDTSSSSSASSRSASGSSMHSFTSSASTCTSASTSPSNTTTSVPLSPVKSKPPISSRTPFQGTPQSSFRFPTPSPGSNSPYTPVYRLPNRQSDSPQDDMLMMLGRDVDYEPLSPKKSGSASSHGWDRTSTPTSRPRSRTHGQMYTPSRHHTHSSQSSLQISQSSIAVSVSSSIGSSMSMGTRHGSESHSGSGRDARRKTTEEKKMLLGTMLGNVDALVEGVRKASIWGLS